MVRCPLVVIVPILNQSELLIPIPFPKMGSESDTLKTGDTGIQEILN